MNVLIIEDEPLAANDLQFVLRELAPTITVLAVLDSISDTIHWLEHHPEPDLMFCDIQLSDGSSFEIFSKRSLFCPIIFTTAYNEYALRAFKLNSIDYLLKPIDRAEMARALEKLQRLRTTPIPAGLLQQQLSDVVEHLAGVRPMQRYKHRFLVHTQGMTLLVDITNIACFIKDEIIFLVTLDGKRFMTDYESVDEVEECLDPALFFRANRQTMLHITAVERFKTEYSGKLLVYCKAPLHTLTVDISREKAPLFKKWLG